MIGRVISTKLKNTTTVLVERTAVHPLYKKSFVRSKKYLADDEVGVKDGDIVEIIKTRPISKNKHWKIVKVLGRSLAEIAEQQMKEKAEEVIAEVMPETSESVDQSVSESENTDTPTNRPTETLKKTKIKKQKEVK